MSFVEWLTQTSAAYAQAAASQDQDQAAVAYDTALVAMPTVEEIASNRAVLLALLATNLFGMNLIPTVAAAEPTPILGLILAIIELLITVFIVIPFI